MNRKIARLGLSTVASVAALFTALPSHAQDFYAKGKISIAIERVFGIHSAHNDYDGPGPIDNEDSSTTIGLGWYEPVTPLHWARLAIDGFVIDRLSLGGSLGFFTQTGDAEGDGILFSPRVGYAIPLSDVFTFWPRGGVTYVGLHEGSLFGLTAEAMFVASPKPNWGILFGPTLDIAFLGDEPGESDRDWSQIAFGIPTVGLMATF
jgi:hypothetical protein